MVLRLVINLPVASTILLNQDRRNRIQVLEKIIVLVQLNWSRALISPLYMFLILLKRNQTLKNQTKVKQKYKIYKCLIGAGSSLQLYLGWIIAEIQSFIIWINS